MSGAVTLSTAVFSDAEKADIRRFCGYPPYGAGKTSFQSWRFFQAYGVLEYRLNNMAPAEIQNIRLKINDLYALETAVLSSSDNLDTDKAAVWTHNPNEIRDRMMLLSRWSKKLCLLVGAPFGPHMDEGARVSLVL